MQTNIYQLYNRKLNGLTVFRALLEDVLIQRLQKLLRACEESDAETLTCTYGAFTSALFEKNVNFSEALLELVLADENRFLLSAARKEVCPPAIWPARTARGSASSPPGPSANSAPAPSLPNSPRSRAFRYTTSYRKRARPLPSR